MKTLSERIADAIATHDMYSILGFDPKKRVFVCPMPQHVHKNMTPSFSIFTREKKQYFKCHGNCDLEGDVVDLIGYMRVGGYNRRDPAKIAEAVSLLDNRFEIRIPTLVKEVRLSGREWVDFYPAGLEVTQYAATRGLTTETLAKFKIGQFGHYMTIPCFEDGKLMGVKMRNTWKCSPDRRFWQLEGSRQGLFNFDSVYLMTQTVFIVKGEIPAMLMDQLGYLACAPTGGEGGWTERWRTALAVAPKVVIGDNDGPGKKLAEKRSILFGAALQFPPDRFKDLDEWILAEKPGAVEMLDYWKRKTFEEWW